MNIGRSRKTEGKISTMYPKIKLPSAKQALSAAASLAATAMLVRSFARDLLPLDLHHLLSTKFRHALNALSGEVTLFIDEHDGLGRNQLFHAAELYTSTIASPNTRALRASLPEKEKKILVTVGNNEKMADSYRDVKVKWRMVATSRACTDERGRGSKVETRHFELIFHKNHKNLVIDEYLPFVVERSKDVKEAKKTLKLHTLASDGMRGSHRSPWRSMVLDHPANFQTLAMDDEIKSMVIEDIDRFLKKKELYRRVGKAWKRGYLLFGPPGTGKTSMIAAMANHLNFDVYDLELTDVRSNSDLRKVLLWTENRSILVVEDIDASIDLSERNSGMKKTMPMMHLYSRNQGQKVTLSGLLNFIDGLWSSCGEERIIIFTTNHKEKLDPALLRPGRMDVHIHMSYCTPCGFRLLSNNYLGLTDHPLGPKAESLIASAQVTPAEVGEQLLKHNDPTVSLEGLIKFLEERKEARRENLEMTNVEKKGGKGGDGRTGHDEILKRSKETSEEMG